MDRCASTVASKTCCATTRCWSARHQRAPAAVQRTTVIHQTVVGRQASVVVRGAPVLAVAGPPEKLAIIPNSHKSVAAGLVLSGIEPVWIYPRWDAALQLADPPTAADVARVFNGDVLAARGDLFRQRVRARCCTPLSTVGGGKWPSGGSSYSG